MGEVFGEILSPQKGAFLTYPQNSHFLAKVPMLCILVLWHSVSILCHTFRVYFYIPQLRIDVIRIEFGHNFAILFAKKVARALR